MVARTQEDALRQAAMRTNRDGFEIQNENFLTNPAEIPDGQLPGQVDVDSRLDNDPFANLRAKKTQNAAFQSRGDRESCQE
jgi:hypothetical protein